MHIVSIFPLNLTVTEINIIVLGIQIIYWMVDSLATYIYIYTYTDVHMYIHIFNDPHFQMRKLTWSVGNQLNARVCI